MSKRLTLELDQALYDYLFAVSRVDLHGDLKETAIYFIRSGVIKCMESENLRQTVIPHLPPKLKAAWSRP